MMDQLLRASIPASVLAMLMLWHPSGCIAGSADPDPSMFAFNAFGTLGVVHSSDSQADFTSTSFKPDGAGYTHSWSAEVDSLFGAQLTANLTSQLSAVLQLIAAQNYANRLRPEVEWANIKYQLTPDFGIRIGRIELPLFLVSDTRNVAYANPWVRPPLEVYDIEPLTRNDGIDLSYRLHLGEVTTTVSAAYGRSYRVNFPLGYSAEVRDLRGLIDKTEYGAALFNLSYVAGHVTLGPTPALFQDFREFGAAGDAIADTFELTNKLLTIVSFGASYDPGKWFATAEWTQFDSRSLLGTKTGWYLSGGVRVAKFTPFLTYSASTATPTSAAGLNTSTLPASVAGTASALNAGLNGVLGTLPVQRTQTAGVRWDFHSNLDLKVQFDHSRMGPGSAGTLINVQPGFHYGGTVNLFSAAIDFVF
jgi:hypothetical protein